MFFNLLYNKTVVSENYNYDLVGFIFIMLFSPLTDFLTIMTFIYLFYYMGTASKRNAKNQMNPA